MNFDTDEYASPGDEENGTFLRWLASEEPLVNVLLDENIRDYDNLIPHLLMADIGFTLQKLAFADPGSADLNRILGRLDNAFPSADVLVQEMLVVSFIENMDRSDAVVQLFGPNLRAAAEYF